MTREVDAHPSWPELTDRQREAVNEVWDALVVPALERVDTMRRERDAALIELQGARDAAEYWRTLLATTRTEGCDA